MKFSILFLHLPVFYAFKTPTSWVELNEKKCTSCAFSMRKHTFQPLYTVKKERDTFTKIRGFQKLIRSESILPTSLLCFSGGFIVNPSIIGLLQTPSFIVSTVNTLLIMSSSMIVNDIFDIENDRINSPHRVLVTGDVSIREAFMYLIGLLSLTEYLNIRFLSPHLQSMVHLSIIHILLYTPIYKRIPFLKNIFCAIMVSFSLFFTGLSATKGLIELNPGFSILSVTLSILFFGSWYNEVLLDMTDVEGDRENVIYTVPVLYGLKNTWFFSGFLLFFNILSNTLSLSYLFDRRIGFILPLIFSPIVYDFLSISRESFSVESIRTASKNTRKPLIYLVVLLCGLSLFNTGFILSLEGISISNNIDWLNIAITLFL